MNPCNAMTGRTTAKGTFQRKRFFGNGILPPGHSTPTPMPLNATRGKCTPSIQVSGRIVLRPQTSCRWDTVALEGKRAINLPCVTTE